MKGSIYYILGIMGALAALYYSVLVLGIETQNGALMFSSGLVIFASLIILLNFPKAKYFSAGLILMAAVSNLLVNNSIFTSILPAALGILIVEERGKDV